MMSRGERSPVFEPPEGVFRPCCVWSNLGSFSGGIFAMGPAADSARH